ncbi:MAG: AIR synthase related protein, partial [Patescibacteria group bacterium]
MKKYVEPTFDFLKSPERAGEKFLADNRVALKLSEAQHFQKAIGRPLTLTELVILGIQGSEHCSYRSTRNYLKKLPTNGKNVILGPGEDAGIVEIAREKSGKKWGLVIGHESHNHPSQIVPFEGAATGVGGIVRDIICMGARVIGCLDVLRFGEIEKPLNRWLAREVVAGIAGYGNPLGVPNL